MTPRAPTKAKLIKAALKKVARARLPAPLPDAERVVWHTATHDVKPLPKKRRLPPPILSAEELAKKPIKAKPVTATVRSGVRAYDAKLDLHGLTEAGAHALLMEFVRQQQARGARQLLIITGKGAGKGAGKDGSKSSVLRVNVPRWLETEAVMRFISSVQPAPPQLGGEGALIVRLKKPR